ncbi:MAG: hypothetical protein VB957_10730 [Pseudomonadales bacterium]
MKTFIIAIVLLISVPSWALSDGGATVSSNATISKAIRERLAPDLAEKILNAEYDGFYQISGKQKRKNTFRFNRVKDKVSFPDDRWEQIALDVVKKVNFQGSSISVGSRTKSSATAYVVFYKNGIEGVQKLGKSEGLALVMIDQKNVSNQSMPSQKGLSATKLYLMEASI